MSGRRRAATLPVLATAAVLLAVLWGGSASAQLDPGFGQNGRTLFGGGPVPTATYPTGVLGLTDGSTVSLETTSRTSRAGLVKRDPNGEPDSSFGSQGTALLPTVEGDSLQGNQVVEEGDWLVVVSSGMTQGEKTLAIQRFDRATGALALEFGTDGVAAFGPRELIGNSLSKELYPFGLAVDDAGRIYFGASPSYWDAPDLLVRLTPAGKLDPDFGDAGVIAVNVPRNQCMPFEKLARTPSATYLYSHDCIRKYDSSGRLEYQRKYVNRGGNLTTIFSSSAGQAFVAIGNDSDVIKRILKLDVSGDLSPAFGANGNLPSYPEAPDLAVKFVQFDSEGRFVMAGRPEQRIEDEYEPEDIRQTALRLSADGSPDSTFGNNGLVILDSPTEKRNEAQHLATTPDGIVLVASSYFTGLTAIKLDNDGQLVTDFGDHGLLGFRAAFPAEDGIAETLALNGGGTLAAGQSGGRPLFLKYGPNGEPDPGFGEDGALVLPQDFPGFSDTVSFLSRMGNGDFIACIDGGAGVTVARITAGGELNQEFGLGGRTRIANLTECAGISSDGDRILVAGLYGNQAGAVTRLFGNGAWDQTYGDDGWSFLKSLKPNYFWNENPYPPFAFTGLPDGTAIYAFRDSLGKINRNGDPLKRFSGDGLARLPGDPGETVMPYPIAIGLDRKKNIFVGGHDNRNPVVFKLKPDGKPALRFGKRGIRMVNGTTPKTRLTDLKVQSDGRVVISAWSRRYLCPARCENAVVIRLADRGKLDRSFASKGVFNRRFGLGSRANSLSLGSRGIVLGGSAETGPGGSEALIARLKR